MILDFLANLMKNFGSWSLNKSIILDMYDKSYAQEYICEWLAKQGFSFDLEPTSKMPKKQNWLFSNMK